MSFQRIAYIWLVFTIFTSSAVATITFGAPHNTPVGTFPDRLAVGDVNGDGVPDVLVLNRDSHSVTVLLGNGNGTLTTGQTYNVPVGTSFPVDLAVGDFNKDGHLDMAIAVTRVGGDGDDVQVFLGNGDGTFQNGVSYPTNGSPRSLKTADLDGDGNLDLIVGNNSQSLSILSGNGDGTFKAAVSVQYRTTAAGGAEDLAIADLNRDGHPDVAIADLQQIVILINKGDGTFLPSIIYPHPNPNATNNLPTSLTMGDFNGDGIPDIAMVEYQSNMLWVYLGIGDGTFGTPVMYGGGVGPGRLVAWDFDGDGRIDLAVAASGDNAVTLQAGNGDGTFTWLKSAPAGTTPFAVAVGDFNGDSVPDLVVANSGSNTVSVLLNLSQPVLTNDMYFTRQQYLDFLDRQPDTSGLSSWTNALKNGMAKADLINDFMQSSEFAGKGKFVAQAYLGVLARDADYSGFRHWLSQMENGGTELQVITSFLQSSEFQNNFGSNLDNSQFVNRLYENILLRQPDSGGYNYWTGQLNSGSMTRPQLALAFLQSSEFQNLTAIQNRVNVSLMYFDMLRRQADQDGFNYWVNVLNSGTPLTDVISQFLASPEYQGRFQ